MPKPRIYYDHELIPIEDVEIVRKRIGLSRRAVARRMGKSHSTVYNYWGQQRGGVPYQYYVKAFIDDKDAGQSQLNHVKRRGTLKLIEELLRHIESSRLNAEYLRAGLRLIHLQVREV